MDVVARQSDQPGLAGRLRSRGSTGETRGAGDGRQGLQQRGLTVGRTERRVGGQRAEPLQPVEGRRVSNDRVSESDLADFRSRHVGEQGTGERIVDMQTAIHEAATAGRTVMGNAPSDQDDRARAGPVGTAPEGGMLLALFDQTEDERVVVGVPLVGPCGEPRMQVVDARQDLQRQAGPVRGAGSA